MPPEISSAARPPVPYRHAARTGQLRGVDIGAEIADFHHHRKLRMMDIHRQMGEPLQQVFPRTCADFRRSHRERLVAAFGLYFEGTGGLQLRSEILGRPLPKIASGSFSTTRARENAEMPNTRET